MWLNKLASNPTVVHISERERSARIISFVCLGDIGHIYGARIGLIYAIILASSFEVSCTRREVCTQKQTIISFRRRSIKVHVRSRVDDAIRVKLYDAFVLYI